MIVGIILAAGESTRMGTPKPLLKLNGETFLEHILSVLKASRIGTIKVILGHQAEQIRRRLSLNDVDVIINKEYKKGQLSSLVAGILSLESEQSVDGIMVCLVDHPLVRVRLVDELIDRFYKSDKWIVVPKHEGKRGHPVIFSKALFPDLLKAPLEAGAKAVVRENQDKVLEVETEDEGVLIDIDTLEQYRRIKPILLDTTAS